jgi:hypothetical protein
MASTTLSAFIMLSDKLTAILATLPTLPGVYRMLGAQGEILYVGKAKVLKKSRQFLFSEKYYPSQNPSFSRKNL